MRLRSGLPAPTEIHELNYALATIRLLPLARVVGGGEAMDRFFVGIIILSGALILAVYLFV